MLLYLSVLGVCLYAAIGMLAMHLYGRSDPAGPISLAFWIWPLLAAGYCIRKLLQAIGWLLRELPQHLYDLVRTKDPEKARPIYPTREEIKEANRKRLEDIVKSQHPND